MCVDSSALIYTHIPSFLMNPSPKTTATGSEAEPRAKEYIAYHLGCLSHIYNHLIVSAADLVCVFLSTSEIVYIY